MVVVVFPCPSRTVALTRTGIVCVCVCGFSDVPSSGTNMVSTASRFLPTLVTLWLLAGCSHVSPGCFPDVAFFVAIVVTCLHVDGGARSSCTSQYFRLGKGPPCSFVSSSLSLSGLARRRLTLVSISVSKSGHVFPVDTFHPSM